MNLDDIPQIALSCIREYFFRPRVDVCEENVRVFATQVWVVVKGEKVVNV